MELELEAQDYRQTKGYRIALVSLMAVLILMLLPVGIAIGSELGGYVSEKVISSVSPDASRLVIGGGTLGSMPDIVMSSVEGIVNPFINPTSGEFQLTSLSVLMLVVVLIFFLLFLLKSNHITIFTLVVMAVLIYLLVYSLPGIQNTITSMLGG